MQIINFTMDGRYLIKNGKKTQTRRPVKGEALEHLKAAVMAGEMNDFDNLTEADSKYAKGFAKIKEGEIVKSFHPLDKLKVTSVRLERLQDISEEDCIAEGVDVSDAKFFTYWFATDDEIESGDMPPSFKSAFEHHIWRKLPYPSEHLWDSNPLVWVYDFEEVS